jgi:hypothetical protein
MVLILDAITMGFDYYASSPVLIPPQNHLPFITDPPAHKYVSKYPKPPSLNYLARTTDAIAGRKRGRSSCDDDAELTDELETASRPISSHGLVRPEPVMGPGMTLIYPDAPALNISPESQSGTWLEEQAERPKLAARKSQRRISDPKEDRDGIDPIVRALGIGWKHLSDDDAGVRGSETFVRKHFGLTNPRVLLHHEGLGVHVVRSEPPSAQGYWRQWWLFREDLRGARFLCNDDADLFRRLGNKRRDGDSGCWIPDILCEGPEVMACDRPVMGGASDSPDEKNVEMAVQPVEDVVMEE